MLPEISMINIAAINLGRIGYKASLHLQNRISAVIKEKTGKWKDGVLLLMEYPPLYTVGLRTKDYPVSDEKKLQNIGAEFYKTDRGGLITYHGPGQLVVYPILDLKCWGKSHCVRWYIETLECTIINLCETMGVTAHRFHSHPGIWVGEKKLCAIGVHASRHITTHGIAINCNTDLNWFKHIVPCGIEGKGVTSLSELLNREVTIEEVVSPFFHAFQSSFVCQLQVLAPSDMNLIVKNV